ncbi:LysR family transcriptional regulator [Paenibacillus sp. YIM B09110]|uniref:LysR family transcriptional regulator n=1 Tax=Paenibacillus sp. YIM B09110 TaxID=3126102 RepID=UPI00301DFDEF
MDLKELTAFRTILQEGNFTRAAEKLNYAQSTITNQIQRLEKELGLKLFKRGWDMELTDAGKVLAEEIDGLIAHWNYVSEQAKALSDEEIGEVRIGALEGLMTSVLPNAFREYQTLKPNITCHLVMGNTDSLSQSILQDELDFALCGEPSDPTPFRFEPLYNEYIAFVVDSGHPLSDRNSIPFEELLNYSIVIGGRTCLYHLRIAKQLSRYTRSSALSTVNQISAIPYFIRQTAAVGVVLDSTLLPPDVVKVEVEMDDSTIQVGLLQLRKDEYISASKKLLMKLITEQFQLH